MKLLAGLAITLLLGIAVLLVLPIHGWGGKESAKSTQDISNMKQLSMALKLYTVDNDGRLPLGANWSDQADKYTQPGTYLGCLYVRKSGGYGHVMERSMPGCSLKTIPEPEKQAMIFDGVKLERNATDSLLGMDYSRHPKPSAAVAYADGHVKRFSPPGLSR